MTQNAKTYDTDVLVAGGGPVGMTTALELASHGVKVILVEQNSTTTDFPKMDITSGRSMDLFRRLGLAEEFRKVAVPEENPFDVLWVTRAGPKGHLLKRFAIPSVKERREITRKENDGSMTLEPYMRVSQVYLEPVLKRKLEENPLIDVRFGFGFDAFEQDDDGVTSTIVETATGKKTTIRSQYLAGCDGGGSKVRKQLGIQCEGEWCARRSYMVHFMSRNLDVLAPHGVAWHLQWHGGGHVAQDDVEFWSLTGFVPVGMDESEIDPRQHVKNMYGQDFEDFDVIRGHSYWAHLVVANKYGEGRVWMAGDAVHQFIPTGGYGMNTGIGEAVDLGWKLAACVNGWGGPALLQSINDERRPVALANREAAKANSAVRFAIADLYYRARAEGDLEPDTEEAAARRAELTAKITELGNLENEAWGIEQGYRYRASPVICNEGNEPPYSVKTSLPTTWPGSRLPHLYLSNGEPIYDLLGKGFTLIAFGGADVGAFPEAADAAGIPLTVVELDEYPQEIYERKLLLVRPDQHVAWRGDKPPANAKAVMTTVSGNYAV